MKLFCVFVLAGVLLSEASELIELNCPKDWIIQGQVIYAESSNNVAMCLICQQKTERDPPFRSIESCIFESVEFQKGTFYRRKQKICGHESENSFNTKLNISVVCKKQFISPMCGIKITNLISIDVLPEDAQFLPCDKSKLLSNLNNTVDIKCPKNWKFDKVEQRNKTYYLNNVQEQHRKRSEMCVTCNLLETNKKNFICTTLELWSLISVLGIIETGSKKKNKAKHTEKAEMAVHPNDSCGCQLTYNKTGYHFSEEKLLKCDKLDFGKSIDLKEDAINSYLEVSMCKELAHKNN
jgi:hypothetical protein